MSSIHGVDGDAILSVTNERVSIALAHDHHLEAVEVAFALVRLGELIHLGGAAEWIGEESRGR